MVGTLLVNGLSQMLILHDISEKTSTCSKSTIETLEKGVKYVQN